MTVLPRFFLPLPALRVLPALRLYFLLWVMFSVFLGHMFVMVRILIFAVTFGHTTRFRRALSLPLFYVRSKLSRAELLV